MKSSFPEQMAQAKRSALKERQMLAGPLHERLAQRRHFAARREARPTEPLAMETSHGRAKLR